MADNNFLSSLLNYGQSLAQHYLPDQQAPQAGQGMLSNIYSTIDSTKRKLSDFVQNPVESTRQFISNQNEDSGKQLGLLNQAFTGADGRPTISPQTPQAQAAHNQLTDGMTAAMMGATVWHGSPHKFDAFDSSKIGTGEGAQAYGHGLYLADTPDVARTYSASTSAKNPNDPVWLAQKMMGDFGNSAKAKQQLENTSLLADQYKLPEIKAAALGAMDLIKSGQVTPKGNLYKVDLPDEHIAKMLNYDAPVPASQLKPINDAAMRDFGSGATGTSGEKLYKETVFNFKMAGHQNPTQAATDWLTQQGVPGMRYLDGGSRATGGTSNYVVFPGNEHLLSIQERNGVPLKSLLNK